jgi:uncharacterized protein (UPF0332 family)
MNELAEGLWERALDAMRTAEHDRSFSPDACASRAYYAAFYAASALFASEGHVFRKHTALEAAVHRDLVNSARWPGELGEAYTFLSGIRLKGDYGNLDHVSPEQAAKACQLARQILERVAADTGLKLV